MYIIQQFAKILNTRIFKFLLCSFFPLFTYGDCLLPDTLNILTVSDNFTIVTWKKIADFSEYTLVYKEVGATDSTVLTQTENYVTIKDLPNNSLYEFQLQAVCEDTVRFGPLINQQINYETSSPPCTTPENVFGTLTQPNEATISWDEVAGADSYIVRVSIDTLLSTTTFDVPNTYFTLLAPLPNVPYRITVAAICGNDTTSFSQPFTPTFSISLDCPSPADLTATNITTTSMQLSWTVETIDEFVFLLTQENTQTGQVKVRQIISDTYETTVDNLSPNTPYTYSIQAICGDGSVSSSVAKTFITAKVEAMVADLDLAIVGQDTAQLIRNDKYVDNGDNQTYFLLAKPTILENTTITKITTLAGDILVSDTEPTVANLKNGQVIVHPNNSSSKGMINYTPNRNRDYDYLEYELTYEDDFQIESDTAAALICPQDSICNTETVLGIITSIPYPLEKGEEVLVKYWPNPVQDKLHIDYNLPKNSYLSCIIYDAMGRKVKEVLPASTKQLAGNYTILIDTDELLTGLYYCQLTINDQQKTFKIMKRK